ncbi:unnamed protein product [Brassica napus]|uniref:(rape) hypothetical protein n=1 Tax=Brassica napus TaxID=3708 RepID=A0A816P5L9_BRANA|nr:unnamed protein product [Brassica napus]
MKNVAKCDTWCELQNPVNHRVFERKLRPKPSGRGHVCLGVTNRRPPSLEDMGRKLISRVLPHASDVPVQKLLMTQSPQRDPSLEKRPQRRTGPKFLERGAREGESPSCPDPVAPRGAVYESGCLGMQPQSGGKFRPRLNMGERPIANKYRESQRVLEIVGREADGGWRRVLVGCGTEQSVRRSIRGVDRRGLRW